MSHSDDLDTVDGVVSWFMHDANEKPRENPSHNEADLRMLIESMIEKPDPFSLGNGSGEAVSLWRAWNWILDFNLLYLGGRIGWIDRDGKMWGCGYAHHDHLLYWLNMEQHEAEALGWVRVLGHDRYRSRYRMNSKQRSTMKKINVTIKNDIERTLPIWVENDAAPISTANLGADPLG